MFSPCVEVALIALFPAKFISPQSKIYFTSIAVSYLELLRFLYSVYLEKAKKTFLSRPVLPLVVPAQYRSLHHLGPTPLRCCSALPLHAVPLSLSLHDSICIVLSHNR
jgi:hypothetical protein